MGASLMLSVDSSWCCSSVVKDSGERFHGIKHLVEVVVLVCRDRKTSPDELTHYLDKCFRRHSDTTTSTNCHVGPVG